MNLNQAHKSVRDALKEGPLTKLELKLITGQSHSGLRGRISEMRRLGYDIRFENSREPVKKYYLISEPSYNADKVLDWMEKKNLFDYVVHYSAISDALGISIEDVNDAMAEIFKTHIVVQLSKDTVKVRKRAGS